MLYSNFVYKIQIFLHDYTLFNFFFQFSILFLHFYFFILITLFWWIQCSNKQFLKFFVQEMSGEISESNFFLFKLWFLISNWKYFWLAVTRPVLPLPIFKLSLHLFLFCLVYKTEKTRWKMGVVHLSTIHYFVNLRFSVLVSKINKLTCKVCKILISFFFS